MSWTVLMKLTVELLNTYNRNVEEMAELKWRLQMKQAALYGRSRRTRSLG